MTHRLKIGGWILLGALIWTLGVSAAPKKPFPRHWGAPPRIQTQDYIPLPGGYGMGSSTLAAWIKRNMERDARQPNAVPKLKPFPAHWGPPPRIQPRDYRPLPGGYGHGSSTLARWIQQNLDRDARLAREKAAAVQPLYTNDFSSGKLGTDLFVLDGDFRIVKTTEGHVLELPGAPLKNFGLLFGPNESANIVVQARIRGDSDRRRHPSFAVGLAGVSGYQLRVAPAKKHLELLHHGEVIAQAPFNCSPGAWTHLKIQSRRAGDRWHIEGRAWTQGSPEPTTWALSHIAKEKPLPGRPSLWGHPFANRPIHFDDLTICRCGL